MSLKSRLFSILTVAIAGLAFSTFTMAQDTKATTPAPAKDRSEKQYKGEGRHEGRGGYGDHRGGGMMMMKMLHDLNLTDAQKTQIHSIMEANKPDEATQTEMRTLGEAKRNGTLTADQQARFETLREQSRAKFKAVHEQILAVLTPEQRTQLEQKMQEMRQHHEQQEKTPAATTEKPNGI